MYMRIKVTFTSMRQYNKTGVNVKAVHLSVIYFQKQIPKFSQDTLLHFISKSLKLDDVLLRPILLYFQIFENDCCQL